MLKTLIKKQLMEIFRSYFYDQKKNKARSKRATALYVILFAVLMVGVLGGMFAILGVTLCRPLCAAGMDWMYFAIFGLISIFLGAFGSVFNTYSQLYLAKDNDLLLSLPIKVSSIIAARLLGVYLLGLMYASVVIVPAVIVYWAVAAFTPTAVIGGVLITFLISVIVLLLSCLLGWVVAKVSLRLKNKSFITVIISLVFFGAYYFVCFKAQEVIAELVQNAAALGQSLKASAYVLYLFGRCATGDVPAMAIITGGVLLAAALCWRLLSRSFLKIATASGAAARKKSRQTAIRRRSVRTALLQKELSHFTSSANYMLNCGLGVLLLPVGGVVLLLKGESLRQTLYGALGVNTDVVIVILAAGVCMLASMNDMAEPSVSLEGKNLWLLQSLPLTPWQALAAKLQMQLILSGVPTLFCAACAASFAQNAAQGVMFLLVCAAHTAFMALLDLAIGLKMPNLTWTSEIVPIKQSLGVMLALFASWAYALAMGGGYLLVSRAVCAEVYLLIVTVVTAAGSALLYRWLKKRGTEIFAAL